MWHRWSLRRASRKMTFYSPTARIHLSSGHLCAETMTVRVACGAQCPGGSNSSRGALRALASQGVPCCFASIPPPPNLRLCSPRSGHKVLSYSHQTVWLEAAADVTVFVFGFVSPICPLFFLQRWLPGRLVCAFLRSWKKRGLWKRSWGLGFCNLWIAVFFFVFFKLPLTQQPKVQSKQTEANGFIFSCTRLFAHNGDASFCPFYNQF